MASFFGFLKDLALAYCLTVLALSLIYIGLAPVSTVMVGSFFMGDGIHQRWVPIERMSPSLIRAVIAAEDARFCDHHGIDWEAIDKAARDAERRDTAPRGASTITMQLTKNLFLWNGRSWLRKAIEAPIALWIDLIWSKTRILEVYLNVAEWGEGVFGAEEASRRYFGVSANRLSGYQASLLASALPDPMRRNPGRPGPATRGMASTIAARAYGADTSCIRR